jgi:hypothetical protein
MGRRRIEDQAGRDRFRVDQYVQICAAGREEMEDAQVIGAAQYGPTGGKLRSHVIISNYLLEKELYEGCQMVVMTEHARAIDRRLPKLIFFTLFRFKWGPVAASLLIYLISG